MIEIEYDVACPDDELREMFAAEVDGEELLAAHDEPWTSRGLEPPRRSAAGLRKAALANFLEHAATPGAERVLTLREAAPWLELSERQLRHDVDQGRYDEALTTTRDGMRALRFAETSRTWEPPRFPRPDPRVLAAMAARGVAPGESYEFSVAGSDRRQTYRRRHDGECWKEKW